MKLKLLIISCFLAIVCILYTTCDVEVSGEVDVNIPSEYSVDFDFTAYVCEDRHADMVYLDSLLTRQINLQGFIRKCSIPLEEISESVEIFWLTTPEDRGVYFRYDFGLHAWCMGGVEIYD